MLAKTPHHNRIKPGRFESREHEDFLRGLGCLACKRPAIVHHLRHFPGGPGRGQRSGSDKGVPLCAEHHTDGPESVHQLGHEDTFNETHKQALAGMTLLEWADYYASKSPCERTRCLTSI